MKGCLILRIIHRAQLITIAEKPTLCWLELLKPPLCFLGYCPQETWVISFSSNFSSEIDSIQGTFWEGKQGPWWFIVVCYAIQVVKKPVFTFFFECAFLANHVGTQSPLLGIWIHSPYTWLLKLEQPLAAHFSERSSLLHAEWFGLQEMEWSLTVAKLISMFGRHNLEKLVYKNLVWCAPKPSNLDKSPSAFGEIAIANFFFFFSFLGLVSLYFFVIHLYILVLC